MKLLVYDTWRIFYIFSVLILLYTFKLEFLTVLHK